MPDDIYKHVRSLEQLLEGETFSSRLHRFVFLRDPTDDWGRDGGISHTSSERIERLADEGVANPTLVFSELNKLCEDKTGNCFEFARNTGLKDVRDLFLERIVAWYLDGSHRGEPYFLLGYLSGLSERDRPKWEETAADLINHPLFLPWCAAIATSSEFSERIVEATVSIAERGEIDVSIFGHWINGRWLRRFPEPLFVRLQRLFLRDSSQFAIYLALTQCDQYYCDEGSSNILPDELVFELLTHHSVVGDESQHRSDYYWSRLAKRHVANYPSRSLAILSAVLKNLGEKSRFLQNCPHAADEVLPEIIRKNGPGDLDGNFRRTERPKEHA